MHCQWWCLKSAKGSNRVTPALCPRCREGLPRASAGSLPGGHLQVSHHLPGLPDDEETREAGGSLRVRQAAPEHHLAQLQLHGAAAAVRIPGAHHHHHHVIVVRGGGGQPFGAPAGEGQGHAHAHLPVRLQLPRVCGCALGPQ